MTKTVLQKINRELAISKTPQCKFRKTVV